MNSYLFLRNLITCISWTFSNSCIISFSMVISSCSERFRLSVNWRAWRDGSVFVMNVPFGCPHFIVFSSISIMSHNRLTRLFLILVTYSRFSSRLNSYFSMTTFVYCYSMLLMCSFEMHTNFEYRLLARFCSFSLISAVMFVLKLSPTFYLMGEAVNPRIFGRMASWV